MKVWQIIGLVVLGLTTFVGGIILLVFQLTGGIVDAADGFFEAAHAGDYETAYSYTSQSVQRDNSLEDVVAFIEINGFDEVVDTSWGSRSIENTTGHLSGTVTTASGASIPVEIDLVQEGEEWKITVVERTDQGFGFSPQQGAEPATSSPEGPPAEIAADVPKSANVRELFADHTIRFLESVVDEDHLFWAPHWTEGTNFMDLERRFPSTEAQADQLRPLLEAAPHLERAGMSGEQLVLQGTTSADGITLDTTGIFTLQGEEWKLAQFEYEVEEL